MNEQEYLRMMTLSATVSHMKDVADTLDILGFDHLSEHQDSIRYELEAEIEILQSNGALVEKKS